MADSILTPISLWENFDDTLPLKDIVINSYKSNSIKFSNVYFSGRKIDDFERVRIYGIFAEPSSKPKGSILIIPDACDSIDREIVFHFAKQNYNVLCVDIKGENSQESNFTKYPKSIEYANFNQSSRTFEYCDNSAKETCWYEWASVARYGVSFLKNKFPKLKIGVLGIKNGANVGWMLAGTDKRVNACTFLYGAGWLAYKGIHKNSDEELSMNDERYRFLAGIEAQTYAPYVECPLIYLGSTNSKNFDIERASDTLSRVSDQSKCWCYFNTIIKDCLDEHSLNTVDYFFNKFVGFDKVYMPFSPEISLKIDGDDLIFEVEVDEKEEVSSILVNSSSNDINPQTRVWYNVPFYNTNSKGKKIFKRRIFEKSELEIFYVSVNYKNGLTVSSKFKFDKINLEGTSKVPGVLFSSTKMLSSFLIEDNKTELIGNVFPVKKLYEIRKGPSNIFGLYTDNTLTTYAIKKLSQTISDESFIKFDVYSEYVDNLTVKITNVDGVEFFTSIKLKGGDFWQPIMIEINDFKDKNGISIKDYSKILSISLNTVGSFMINNFIVF